jgi:hypothetical protein
MRSFLPRIEVSTVSPELSTPEYTRMNDSWPTKGSVMILNASAAKGSSSPGLRNSGSPLSFSPLTGGMSTGEGR